MTQMTVELLQAVLPKNLHLNATQEFADQINTLALEPEAADVVRQNFLTYSKVLKEGKYKTEDYLNAVVYASHKIMGYDNKDAYIRTFPDRYQALVAKGTSEKDISAYVAMYHKGKMVTAILEQATVPAWLLHQDAFNKAVQTQYDIMTDDDINPRDRTAAANSLMTHLKAPEVKKVELDVSVKREGGLAELEATLNKMAAQQKQLIEQGASAKTVARIPLVQGEVIDGEFVEVAP